MNKKQFKLPENIGLEHCGEKIMLMDDTRNWAKPVTISMVIKGQNGRLVLYDNPPTNSKGYPYAQYQEVQDIQSEAIKLFMEANR